MQTAPSEAQMNVFIVEDSASIRERLAAMLGDIEGVNVVGQAESPGEALEGILRTRPDSVVLDIHLIGGSGLDVLRQAHLRRPETVFIVLTNYPNPQYRRVCMEAGAAYFFDKSSEIAKVREVIAGLGATRH
ncbi:MAG TPA: response regulator transcription factor [Burkholderiales bacterium]|nr:response regulator transcription factor [Burkholderiales bacterium]